MKLRRNTLWTIVATGILAASNTSAEEPRTIFEVAQDIQSFYPLGSGTIDATTLDFYVMAGLSTKAKATIRGAALINTSSGPGERIQIVEVSSITCAARTMKPTFRLVLNSKGQRLASGGPVSTDRGADSTLLTPNAQKLAIALLCEDIVPPNALENRSLADFR